MSQTTVGDATIYCDSQDTVYVRRTGAALQRVPLEDLDRAAHQEDAGLAAYYRPLFAAALALHNDLVGADVSRTLPRPTVPERPYITLETRAALERRAEQDREARRQRDAEMARVVAERARTEADDPWWPIPSWEVPDGVRFDVPRRNQGQMVEIGYGTFGRGEAGPSDPYMDRWDRSDGSGMTYRRREVAATA